MFIYKFIVNLYYFMILFRQKITQKNVKIGINYYIKRKMKQFFKLLYKKSKQIRIFRENYMKANFFYDTKNYIIAIIKWKNYIKQSVYYYNLLIKSLFHWKLYKQLINIIKWKLYHLNKRKIREINYQTNSSYKTGLEKPIINLIKRNIFNENELSKDKINSNINEWLNIAKRNENNNHKTESLINYKNDSNLAYLQPRPLNQEIFQWMDTYQPMNNNITFSLNEKLNESKINENNNKNKKTENLINEKKVLALEIKSFIHEIQSYLL